MLNGIISYDRENQIATIKLLENFDLTRLLQLVEHFIETKELPSFTRKFIIDTGNYSVIESSAVILTHRGKWVKLFPGAFTAIVSNDPKTIAISALMDKVKNTSKSFATNDDALAWLLGQNSNQITYRTDFGSITYDKTTHTSFTNVNSEFSSEKVVTAWKEVISKDIIPADTLKHIFFTNQQTLTDSGQRSLESRGEWANLFPNAYLAVVSSDPKITAIGTMMNKFNKKTKVFTNEIDAQSWLDLKASQSNTTPKFDLDALASFEYDFEHGIAITTPKRNLTIEEFNNIYMHYFERGLLPRNTHKFIINQGNHHFIGSEAEILENAIKWTALFPEGHTAMVTSNLETIAESKKINQENPRNALFSTLEEAMDWILSLPDDTPDENYIKTVEAEEKIAPQKVSYDPELQIVYLDAQRNIKASEINIFWRQYLRDNLFPHNSTKFIVNIGEYDISGTAADTIHRKNFWADSFPDAFMAVTGGMTGTAAFVSFLKSNNPKVKLCSDKVDALQWVNQAGSPTPMSAPDMVANELVGDFVFKNENDFASIYYSAEKQTSIVNIKQNLHNEEINQSLMAFYDADQELQTVSKTVMNYECYELLDSAEEVASNGVKWAKLFPNNLTAIVSSNIKMLNIGRLARQEASNCKEFIQMIDALRWFKTVDLARKVEAAKSETEHRVEYDRNSQIAILHAGHNFTSDEAVEAWTNALKEGIVPEGTSRLILNQKQYVLTENPIDTLDNKEILLASYPNLRLAFVTGNSKAYSVAKIFDDDLRVARPFYHFDDAVSWLLSTEPNLQNQEKKSDGMAICHFDVATQTAHIDILRNYRAVEINQMWLRLIAEHQLTLNTKKFIFNQGNFSCLSNGAELFKRKSEWHRLFPDAYMATISQDSNFIAYCSLVNQRNPRLNMAKNLEEAQKWVDQADTHLEEKPCDISEIGELYYDEKTGINQVDILRDVQIEELNQMWLCFINDGRIDSGATKVILNQGAHQLLSPEKTVLATQEEFPDLFPNARLAVVSSNPKALVLASMIDYKHKRIRSFEQMNDAVEWLEARQNNTPIPVARAKYNHQSRVATVEVLRDFSTSEMSAQWEEFLREGIIPPNAKGIVFNQGDFKLSEDSAGVHSLKNKWAELFTKAHIAVMTSDPEMTALLSQEQINKAQAQLMENPMQALEWFNSLPNTDEVISKNQLGKLLYEWDKKTASVDLIRDVRLSELNEMWEEFAEQGHMPRSTKRIVYTQGNFTLMDNFSEAKKQEDRWMDLFPEARMAYICNDPRGIAIFSHRFRNSDRASLVNNKSEAARWFDAMDKKMQASNAISEVATARYDADNFVVIIDLNRDITIDELDTLWRKYASEDILSHQTWRFILNLGNFTVIDIDDHLALRLNREWMTLFPKTHLAFITKKQETIEKSNQERYKNAKTVVVGSFQEAINWLNLMMPAKRRNTKAEFASMTPNENGLLVIDILEDLSAEKFNLFWSDSLANGSLPRHTNKFILNLGDSHLVGKITESINREKVWQKNFPHAYMAVVTSDPKMIALSSMAEKENPRIKLVANIDEATKWLEGV
ncbi:MAG: hypothetical protein ACK5LR_08950 [Mangrovibacterium sp.]